MHIHCVSVAVKYVCTCTHKFVQGLWVYYADWCIIIRRFVCAWLYYGVVLLTTTLLQYDPHCGTYVHTFCITCTVSPTYGKDVHKLLYHTVVNHRAKCMHSIGLWVQTVKYSIAHFPLITLICKFTHVHD